jgi:DNA-binding response OmpR family regulator
LLARGQKPDIILLDVMMPEMDGYMVCAALKADAATRDIPVIFVTAKTDAESETGPCTSGGVDFIHKPVNRAVVRARVRLHLELERRSRALELSLAEIARANDQLDWSCPRPSPKAPASILITDDRGQNLQYVNPRFTQETGYSPRRRSLARIPGS